MTGTNLFKTDVLAAAVLASRLAQIAKTHGVTQEQWHSFIPGKGASLMDVVTALNAHFAKEGNEAALKEVSEVVNSAVHLVVPR